MTLLDEPPVDAPDIPSAPAPEEIRAALARILGSEEFASSPRLADFLRFIVETTLAGRGDEIKGYTIAVEALGRPTSFDPQSDPIVRVEATRLRRALERYYSASASGETVEIFVPKGSYVPHFRARMVAADPVPAAEPAAAPPPPSRRARFLVPAIAAGLVVLAGAGILLAGRLQVGLETASNAVTLTVGARQTHAELVADRIGLPILTVTPFELAGSTRPSNEEIHTLEVRLRDAFSRFDFVEVLSGSVEAPGAECRGAPPRSVFSLGGLAEGRPDGSFTLLARLTDRCAGNIIWSREFEGLKGGADRAASEQRVVREIAAAVMEPYAALPAKARAQARLDAPDSGFGCITRAFAAQSHEDATARTAVRACIDRLVAQDNGYGLVHSLKAVLMLDDMRHAAKAPSPDALAEMVREAQLGTELAPASAFAAKVLAKVDFHVGNREGALAAADRALALNPLDYDVAATAGALFIGLGRPEDGEAMINFARTNGAHRTETQDVYLGIGAFLRGDALAAGTSLNALQAHRAPEARIASALALRVMGQPEEEHRVVTALVRDMPGGRAAIERLVHWLLPVQEDARKVLGELDSAGLATAPLEGPSRG